MKSVTQVKFQSSDPLIFESKMVLFTREPNFRGATETHHAGLQKETLLLTVTIPIYSDSVKGMCILLFVLFVHISSHFLLLQLNAYVHVFTVIFPS